MFNLKTSKMVKFVTSEMFFDRTPWMSIQFSFLSNLLIPPPNLAIISLDQEKGNDDLNYYELDISEQTGFNLKKLKHHFSLWIRKSLSGNILWPTVRLAPDAKQE